MNSKALFLILAPCLIVTTSIRAEDAILSFEEMDRDANGYISSGEAKASEDISRHFKEIDTNQDNKINITEFQAYMGKNRMTPPEEMETPEPGAAPY